MIKALLMGAFLAAPLPAEDVAALAVSATVESAEAFALSQSAGLDADLSLLDGGSLTQALRSLALQGVPLRAILDPTLSDTRREGSALGALTPTAQVRWLVGAGKPLRRLIGREKQLLWRPGADPSRADGAREAALQRFEAAWTAAAAGLPEALSLEDELQKLPDPSEAQPRIIRRREAGARQESENEDEDPADQRREGPPEAGTQP